MSKAWGSGDEGRVERSHSGPTPGTQSATSPGAAVPQTPGKRTLVETLAPAPSSATGVVQRKAEDAESTPDPIATAKAGTSGGGGPLPHRNEIQRSFGRHDVSGIRAHQDANTVQATEALGASAFAHGNDVAFGSQPDLHTAAHEAAHVVQQRGGVQLKGGIDEPGDHYEQEADRVADLVVAGKSAESALDQYGGSGGGSVVQRDANDKPRTKSTPDFVNEWGIKFIIAIMDRITAHPPANPHPRLTWVSPARAAEELGLAISHYISAAPDQILKRMMMLSYPADLFALIDTARRGPEGTRMRAAEIATASAFDEPLMASIARMGARAVVQMDQPHTERLRGADIVPSCPLDGLIADFVVRADIAAHTPKKKGGADDTPGKPFAKGAHDVKFEWLGSKDPKLWNWIKVTSPPNATVEDVAQTSLRWDHAPDPEQAYRIAANPPYFGIPIEMAKEIPLARDYAPADVLVKLDTGPGPRVANPSVLGKSKVSDEVALAQAPAHAKGDLPVEQSIERTHTQLQFLRDQLAPWHLAPQLAGAIAFVDRRQHELGADKKAAARYATALSLQERVLHDTASELMQVLEEIKKAGAKPETVDTVPPVKQLLKAYARAAGVSHLHAEAPAALAEARSQRTMLPLSLAEDRIREASKSIADQREAEKGATTLQPNAEKTPASLTSQLERAADLRRAAANGEQIDPDSVETLTVDAGESELRARLVTLATYASALKKRANEVGLKSGDPWDVADVCELMLTKINKPAATQPKYANDDSGGGWHEQLDTAARVHGPAAEKNKVRRNAVKRVSDQLARFSTTLDVNGFFKEAQGKIKDQETWNLIKSIALQIGITLVTGQVLGAAGAAIRGLALAGEIGAEIRNASLLYHGTMILAEAAVNTGVQGALGGKMGVRELAENALATVLTSAAMKPFHSLLGEGVEVEKAIQSWGRAARRGARFAAELVIDTGAGIGAAGVAHAVTHGGEMTKHDAEEWVTMGLSIAASKFVQGRMIAMNHRITEAAIHYKNTKLAALNEKVVALRDRATDKSDPNAVTRPEEAIDLMKRRRELLLQERAIYENDPDLQKQKAKVDGDLAATGSDFVEMPLRLAHLSPLVDGHVYEGSPSEIQNAFSTADKTGVPMQREWIAERNVWKVTSGEHVLEIHERGGGKRPHEADVGAHEVPGSNFVGTRPKGEKKPDIKDHDVHASTRDAAEILNYGEQRSRNIYIAGERRALITVGSSQVRVTVVVGEAMPQVAKHNYRPGATDVTITVSKEARPQDITRAIAHEFAEVQMALEHPASLANPDALTKGAKEEKSLSAHDEGRRAELKVLLYELQSQPQRRAEIEGEITKLLRHLGFELSSVNGDMRARRVFGDEAIAALDTMIGRERLWFKPEEVIDKPDALKPGGKEWVLPFKVKVKGEPQVLGESRCLVDAHGRPISDPEFLLHKDTTMDGKNTRLSLGEPSAPVSVTDFAIKRTIERFRETFGHDPETLPGSLADDNKLIFQRAYAAEILKGVDPAQALQNAILVAPFGKHRAQNKYNRFDITPKGETQILYGHPPQLVDVPANIHVIARKQK